MQNCQGTVGEQEVFPEYQVIFISEVIGNIPGIIQAVQGLTVKEGWNKQDNKKSKQKYRREVLRERPYLIQRLVVGKLFF